MKPSIIENEAMHLSVEERAKLAQRLLESLDDLPSGDLEKLWLEEADKRAAEVDKGKVQLISSQELENRVRKRLK